MRKKKGLKKIINLLTLYCIFTKQIIFNEHKIIFIRYAYYYFPLYLLSSFTSNKYQVEVNSNVTAEFMLHGRKLRAFIDKIIMSFVRKTSNKIHVSSFELTQKWEEVYHEANFVFNPNFVVDESSNIIDRYQEKKIQLLFLGNTGQAWHGIPLFIKSVLIGNEYFKKSCELNLIGNLDTYTQEVIKDCGLEGEIKYLGVLTGEDKNRVLKRMDIGICSFNLEIKGLKETTAIKNAEYLYNGLGLILGYKDASIDSNLPFVLSMDLHGNMDKEREKFNQFLSSYRSNIDFPIAAHKYAKENMLVNKYIEKVLN